MDAQAPLAAAAAHDGGSFGVVYPITILILVGITIPAALLIINTLLSKWAHGTKLGNPGKNEPVESGLPVSVGSSGEKFSIKFYLIAMLFLAFDIEVAFLYPWAYHFRDGGWEMVWLLVVFLVLLEVGYLYLFKKGALDWE